MSHVTNLFFFFNVLPAAGQSDQSMKYQWTPGYLEGPFELYHTVDVKFDLNLG